MSGSGGGQATEKAGAALVKAIREGLPTPNRNAPHFAGRLGVQGGEICVFCLCEVGRFC
jgi:hypothetical protein